MQWPNHGTCKLLRATVQIAQRAKGETGCRPHAGIAITSNSEQSNNWSRGHDKETAAISCWSEKRLCEVPVRRRNKCPLRLGIISSATQGHWDGIGAIRGGAVNCVRGRARRAKHRKTQALTDVECIRCGSDELSSEPAEKRKHLFPYNINERNFGQVYDDLHPRGTADYHHPCVLCIVAGESTLKQDAPRIG